MNFLNKHLKLLRNFVAKDLSDIESFMINRIKDADPFVLQVASHLMRSGGKRIRAILALVFCRIHNLETRHTVRITSSLELIHQATLLHDDVVDHCYIRRGIKSANNLWGNKGSILAGDSLLATSFALATETENINFLSALSSLASELITGEIMELDLSAEYLSDESRYLKLINCKTSSLFSVTCSASSIIAGSDMISALIEFGKNFGAAYQIADDILDYIGTEKSIGKSPGSDFQSKKITLPIIITYNSASLEEKKLFTNWITGTDTPTLKVATEIMYSYDAFRKSAEMAKFYAEKAIASLDSDIFNEIETVNILKDLCKAFNIENICKK